MIIKSLEEFQIYEAMVRPSAYLFISYAAKDNSGKSKRPSLYVNRLRTMFPEMPVWDDIVVEEMYARPLERVVTKEQAFEKLIQYLGDEIHSPVWNLVQQYFSKDIAYFPRREILAYDYLAESKEISYERINCLNNI